jgi:hypothetical protein
MKAAITSLLMVLFLAAGCSNADSYWYRPDRTLEQVRADYTACKDAAHREAAAAVSHEYVDRTQSPTRVPGDFGAAREGGAFDDPLDSWSAWRTPYARNVLAGCMRQKGYQQVSRERLPSGARTKRVRFGAIAGR